MEVVVVKLEDDEEERPCSEMSPEEEGDEQFLANTIRSIKTQTQDNTCLESNTSENVKIERDVKLGKIEEKKELWRRRSTLVKEIFSRGRHRKLEENIKCKKIGLDVDVGSGPKKKLDLQLLTNGVMNEIADFAKALSTKSQKLYIAEILEYNFSIGFENSRQRDIFLQQTWQRVVKMQKCLKQYPDAMFNEPWMLGVKPHNMVPNTSSQTDLRDSGIKSEHLGYAEICVKSESDMTANQDIKVETFSTVSEETRTDLYPLCQEVGLDLDVTYKGWSKEKLDEDVLTKGVMIEVAKYTKELCGTYRQIVFDILEHNFDLDLQAVDSELFQSIIDSISMVQRKSRINRNNISHLRAWYERAFSLQINKKRDPKLAETQSAGMSESDFKKRTCTFSSFERTDEYNDETADFDQIDDQGYMCSLENPGLEPSLSILCVAGDGSSPAPPLTPSYDTHTALCAEKVKLEDIYMRPRLDYYPFCEQAGIDLDVHSKLESKEKHDLQVLTNGVMFEIRNYVRRNRKKKKQKKKAYSRFLYDILDYNFDVSFPNQTWLSFSQRLVWDVKQLKTYHRDVAINPNHATEVFALHYRTPREKKKRETVTQLARTSERIFKKKTCKFSNFERTDPYTNESLDFDQIDDLGYMCPLENPVLEPSLTVLCAAGDGSSPAPPLTSSYDTHTALCAEEVKLEDKRNKRPRRDYRDYFPLCEQAGIDFDVHSKLESKGKHDLQVLTNGVMYEIRKYVRRNRKKKAYSYFLYDVLEYNFDVSFHNEKWRSFINRIVACVTKLAKTYPRDVAINPNHATEVFALPLKMPTPLKKRETVTQPARTSERIFQKKTCKLSNFERTNPYTDGTADFGQMNDLGNMCSQENPGLEPLLTDQANMSHIKKEPNESLTE